MIRCKIFGHLPVNVDTQKFEADCHRCGVRLKVSYDMSYGGTIVEGVKEAQGEI